MGGAHQVHTFFLLVESDPGKAACQEKATQNTCGMEPLYSQDAYKGVIQTAPRTEQIFYAHSIANTGMIETESPFLGPADNDGLMVRAGPQPLYLKNLSLLI